MDKQRAVYLMLELGCWHEWECPTTGDRVIEQPMCIHCELERFTPLSKIKYKTNTNPDLTTWAGFGLMWEAAQKMEWWEAFTFKQANWVIGLLQIPHRLINPARFMDALYYFGISTGRIEEE